MNLDLLNECTLRNVPGPHVRFLISRSRPPLQQLTLMSPSPSMHMARSMLIRYLGVKIIVTEIMIDRYCPAILLAPAEYKNMQLVEFLSHSNVKYDTGFQAAIASVLGSGQQSAKVTFVRCLQKKRTNLDFENILV